MTRGLLILLVMATYATATHGGKTFRILGGLVKEYSKDGDTSWGTAHTWGQTTPDGNSKEIEIQACYCDTVSKDGKDGFCRQKLIVSTTGSTTQEHYQLVGSELRIYDKHAVHIHTPFSNGIVTKGEMIKEMHALNCKTWCEPKNDMMNGDLFFYINVTTQPSSTDDFSYQMTKQGHPDQRHDEVFLEYREPSSIKVLYAGFRRYDAAFGTHGYQMAYVYVVPAALVDLIPIYDQAKPDGVKSNVKKAVTLRNEGSGVSSDDMPSLGTEQIETYTNEARFMTTYDFRYQFVETLSVTVDAYVYEESVGLEMSQEFSYHSEEEMTSTQTITGKTTVTWPDQCPPVFEIKYTMTQMAEEQRLPVKLIFERAGERWTEIDIMTVKLEKIVLTKNQCCITADADSACGGDTPICDGSFSSRKFTMKAAKGEL